jgi:hypothetical protein
MANKQNWVITTSGEHSFSEIKKKVTETGFTVDQVLNEIGCIIGSATDDVVEKLREIPGVFDVSPEPGPINIGPPDASIS